MDELNFNGCCRSGRYRKPTVEDLPEYLFACYYFNEEEFAKDPQWYDYYDPRPSQHWVHMDDMYWSEDHSISYADGYRMMWSCEEHADKIVDKSLTLEKFYIDAMINVDVEHNA